MVPRRSRSRGSSLRQGLSFLVWTVVGGWMLQAVLCVQSSLHCVWEVGHWAAIWTGFSIGANPSCARLLQTTVGTPRNTLLVMTIPVDQSKWTACHVNCIVQVDTPDSVYLLGIP